MNTQIFLPILFLCLCTVLHASPIWTGKNSIGDLPSCQIYSENQCSGNDIITPPEWAERNFQTPLPGDAQYLKSFQYMGLLQGHAMIQYAPDRLSATLTVVAFHKKNANLSYNFNGTELTSNSITACKSGCSFAVSGPFSIKISAADGSTLQLDDIDFYWNIPNLSGIEPPQGDYRKGQKGAIVEFLGWPHADIEEECETLSKMGYMGAKLFPVTEHLMADLPFANVLNPWYFFYQPVSYKLQGRMGTRDDLRKLITTCRNFNVRLYADAVINHMTGSGNDANNFHRNPGAGCVSWTAKNTSYTSNESPFYTQGFVYTNNTSTGLAWTQEFPAVPYGPTDFHCERALNSWTDPLDLNAGWLTGLVDLNTEKPNVQQRIADFLTDLISIGFSGFRIDAAKHIQPPDLAAIFGLLKVNLGGSFPDDFISWLEILTGGEANMLLCDETSGYNYAGAFQALLSQNNITSDEQQKIKIWASYYPKETGADCGQVGTHRVAVQNDDADQQNAGSTSRDMGDQGSVLVKDKNVPVHRSFEVKLFQNPNGISDNDNEYPIRLILSSFWIDTTVNNFGVPDGKSDCSLCRNDNCEGTCWNSSYIKAFNNSSCGYDESGYTHTHRDKTIVLAMRQWMHLSTSVSNEQLGLPDDCQ